MGLERGCFEFSVCRQNCSSRLNRRGGIWGGAGELCVSVRAREMDTIDVGAGGFGGGGSFGIWEWPSLLLFFAARILALCRTATAVDSAIWFQLMLQYEAALRAVGANQEAGFSREPSPYVDGHGGRPPCTTHLDWHLLCKGLQGYRQP